MQAVQAFNAALKSGDVNPQALGVESEQAGAGNAEPNSLYLCICGQSV